jgi:hypothetical protein
LLSLGAVQAFESTEESQIQKEQRAMTECIPHSRLGFHPKKPVEVAFDAPEISSDGGLLLLRQLDEGLGLTEGLGVLIPDHRDPWRTQHSRVEQVRQRIYQVAQGYEDCNDSDILRNDRLFKLACDRSEEDRGLSSQPTLSRLENAVDAASLREVLDFLEDSYVSTIPEDTEVVVLDIDSTSDETHGDEQLSFFHGFYDHHMLHPLLVFDQHGQLITVILRPGNTHASRGAAGLLERLIRMRAQHLRP